MNEERLLFAVMAVVGMVLSTAVHEWAHAMAAYRLGDDTAARMGRLTLSPEAHIDPLGTLLVPALGALFGGMIIGWAKPVPYRSINFTRKVTMRTGELLVAAAGPLSNLVLAVICGALIKLITMTGGIAVWTDNATVGALGAFLITGLWLNLLLAVFNLVPIAPLDGFKVMANIIGTSHPLVRFIESYRMMLFMALIMVGGSIILRPMLGLFATIVSVFGIGQELTILWGGM